MHNEVIPNTRPQIETITISNNVSREWITLKEAEEITGRKTSALLMWIRRRKEKGEHVKVRKTSGKRGKNWIIHASELEMLDKNVIPKGDVICKSHNVMSNDVKNNEVMPNAFESVNLITFETYSNERKEWEMERDQLMQGLMMYRFKYEESERRMRLLPAPPELIEEDLRKRNEITEETRKALAQAKKELQEKEEVIKAEVDYRERLSHILTEKEARASESERCIRELEAELAKEKEKPWWKKIFRVK